MRTAHDFFIVPLCCTVLHIVLHNCCPIHCVCCSRYSLSSGFEFTWRGALALDTFTSVVGNDTGIVLHELLPTFIGCLFDDSEVQQSQMFTLISAEPVQIWFIV